VQQRDSVHLYTLCWNDGRMLPYFFKHYGPLVDRFFVFDNGSTDGSLQMLAGDDRVQVSHFRTEFDSFADTELRLSEEMWKNSNGLADWVLVVDIDEHLYHEDLRSYLGLCRQRGITAIKTVGYEMISEIFPDASARLCDVVANGVRCPEYHDKMCLFDPSAITRTNFGYGRHSASPEGRVKWPAVHEVLLLHYKKLGVEYEITRSAELKAGLRSRDIERNMGSQYLLSPEEITVRFRRAAGRAKPVPRTARELWEEELARLREEVGTRDAEGQRLSVHAARCEAELHTTKVQLAAADVEAARLREELVSRDTKNRDLKSQTAALSSDLSVARRDLSTTLENLKAKEQALSETLQQLQVLLQSRSWKITQPLRSARYHLGRAFRRLQHTAGEAISPNAVPTENDGQPFAQVTPLMPSPASPPPALPTGHHPPARDAGLESAKGSPRAMRTAPLFRSMRELESAMCSKPDDWALRHEYFAVLGEISRSHLGCFYASLPEIATPLMVRASASDIWNLRQIFLDGDHEADPYIYGDYAFAIPSPRRILDLGAYCGYTAVYFANRFPDAEITCVEPPGTNFEALRANTAPYANIRCLAAAVWPERTTLQWTGPVFGDWGNQFTPTGLPENGAIPAYNISDILAMRGWDGADFIKCVVEGVQVDVLTPPDRPWLDRVSLVATKPPKGAWPRPDDESRMFAAFPDDTFERITNRNTVLAFRRRSTTNVPQMGDRQTLPLVPATPGLRAIHLANVDDRFGFYKFDTAGLSLAPNPPGALPASFTCRLDLDHHDRFVARVISGPAPSPSSGVTITLAIRDPLSGAAPIDERLSVPSAGDRVWSLRFTPLSGAHDVTISAELVGPHTPDERIPWVRIIDAQFL
jgi:FkbM family methyltransferase